MLQFKPISINDRKETERYLIARNTRMCEHCFTDLYIWSQYFGTEICMQDDFLFIKWGARMKEPHYLAPVGFGNLKHGISILMEHIEETGSKKAVYGISAEMKAEIETAIPGEFTFYEMRDKADYVYSAKDLMTLAGKKLHSKRNFINRFQKEYEGRFSFCEIDDSKINDVFEFHKKWCAENGCGEDIGLMGEKCAVIAGLKNKEELSLLTGVLLLDNKIIAYSFGSQMSEDTIVVQIEKADHTIDGAYQVINYFFANRYYGNISFVNREEDMGLEGLRKAKLSYNPEFLLMKYKAVPTK